MSGSLRPYQPHRPHHPLRLHHRVRRPHTKRRRLWHHHRPRRQPLVTEVQERQGRPDHALGSRHQFPIPTPTSRPTEITAGANGTLGSPKPSATRSPGSRHRSRSLSSRCRHPAVSPTKSSRLPMATFGSPNRCSSKIGRITPAGVQSPSSRPPPELSLRIATGPDGDLWYTTYYNNTLVKLSPAGVVLAQIAVPTPNADPRRSLPAPMVGSGSLSKGWRDRPAHCNDPRPGHRERKRLWNAQHLGEFRRSRLAYNDSHRASGPQPRSASDQITPNGPEPR